MNIPERDRRLDLAARLVKEAQSIVALAGAGISTRSGIPDFRSPNTGLWERANPMEVASLTAFRRKPEVFYNWLRPLAPNKRSFQSQIICPGSSCFGETGRSPDTAVQRLGN